MRTKGETWSVILDSFDSTLTRHPVESHAQADINQRYVLNW